MVNRKRKLLNTHSISIYPETLFLHEMIFLSIRSLGYNGFVFPSLPPHNHFYG